MEILIEDLVPDGDPEVVENISKKLYIGPAMVQPKILFLKIL